MAPSGLAPRRAALDLLMEVTEERRTLAEVMPAVVEALPPAERARAQRLATDTLRWSDRADRLLGPHLKKRPHPRVLNGLRLAITEIAVHDAPPHGVVNAAVSLSRGHRDTQRAAGMVNAVLRRVAMAQWETLPPPRLPKRLRAPLVKAYGKATVDAIEVAHAAGAPLDLTPRDGDAQALAAHLGGRALPTGSVRLASRQQVTALPGYDEGTWWVQDAAAAIPARVLAPQPGMRVLDLCAAPGGKTLQLAAAGAQVTALDVSPSRMTTLTNNLSRTRLSATQVVADALTWEPDAPFDAILLDAPCSATGTIRRHPDLPHAKRDGDFAPLIALQERLLARASTWLRPGGRLVYCTCSLLPDEGEVQIERFLSQHGGWAPDHAAYKAQSIAPEWLTPEGIRLHPALWPEHGGLDGFFIAALIKGN